ncbi:hypothetical protein [Rhodobacter capsulatus]|uniref:Uncharacterized protein n=1 Tax=Rhodobacter capsulatus (strain ATCC BAA-309 / NBRC 16581 / SB1003) TaxID=272942 RepID=D5AUV0_RHOCB|nr:hypothetical protein [Rhodobacter capsulatus]ADE85739.1 conserved hypothetical protein [Rhodobacter capsulatus SB 1003]ETD01746.1 hypothetical protein U714_11310 [Rhodobacter capsulatus DE442]ETD76814.1 hypothetical protein U717_11465 [Rhodobacter capsulatus R121]ETE53651.1 hypothetical protein U715_11470 [Rhodobacter capsulatus Y262]MDS0927472.1 hypothetical protein [Rhodobacter capsulatus]
MILRGAAAQRRAEIETARALNHQLAGLVAFAVHDPQHLPEFRPDDTAAATAATAQGAREVDHERVRGALIAMALRPGP